ncbi:lactose regulatory protein lac9 and GAL4-like protein [Aspergillus alliaceus]|uniref:Lactose regulatory protein lac9 and GAL4-like protein n=1 Tax=Petromyces alliaceus TaxID=209559 RepID=A0A8H6AAT3_PETAA|nr:lactose regulatory protein lac9 and GAL4-like protein [Aspergillus burnettii]
MSEKHPIFTNQAPAPFPVFSQAIVRKDSVYCSGMIGLDVKTNRLVTGGIQAQTDQLVRNLEAVLKEAHSGLQNVLKMTVYITTMDDFAAMNEIYAHYFSAPMPARTCVAVKELPLGALVEMDCIAYLTQIEEELARARSLLQERHNQSPRFPISEGPSRENSEVVAVAEDPVHSISPASPLSSHQVALQPHNDSSKPPTHTGNDVGAGSTKPQHASRCVLLPPEVAPQATSLDWDERDNTLQNMSDPKPKSSSDGYFGVSSTRAFLRMTGRQDELYPPTMMTQTSVTATDLMPLSSLAEYVDAYFERCHPLHPLLHETAFRAQMMNLYPRPQQQLWEMLLYAVAALGAFSISTSNQNTDRALFDAARARFSNDLMETGNKTLVQALTLMSRYLRIRNKLNASYNYLGLANRVAISIGLFKEFSSADSNPFYCEVRRRVWWCLYTLNLEDTIAFSRPQDFPQIGVEVNLPLNIHDLDLTPNTAFVGAEANYTTLYTYLKFGAAFYSTISTAYASIISVPYPRARQLIEYDDNLVREWEASLPAFIREIAIESPRPFIVWHFIMRHRADPPKAATDPDSVNTTIQRCQKAAEETITMISEFWFQQQRSALDGWYALQFLLPAILIPALCIRNESTSPHSASWQDQIRKAIEVMESISLLLDSAVHTLGIIKSLCSGVVPLENEVSSPHNPPKVLGRDWEPSADANYDTFFEATHQIFPEYLNFGDLTMFPDLI